MQVNSCIYRLHRYVLERHSHYFRRLFASLPNDDGPGSGRSDESAISVSDVDQSDFEGLLQFLYHGAYEPRSLSLHAWKILLGISTQLQFATIRELCIHEITARHESLSAVEAIVLATKYDVPEWLPSAYAELCRRLHPLDDVEAEQLGARVTARIGRARETIREETFSIHQMRRYGARYVPPGSFDEELVTQVVRDVFYPE
ncbi:hypothetical protein OBBRIDRAFT_874447 [Obba rivulosa]|uniref:BTB domain-containing protein n=1 Tax=Obba rivulosa TaxID=1052685 RepID=A0A8E2AUD7_9APHY|nr:hypothetical protein OBBRIDRAFT_874447 [Obba rivulosa]